MSKRDSDFRDSGIGQHSIVEHSIVEPDEERRSPDIVEESTPESSSDEELVEPVVVPIIMAAELSGAQLSLVPMFTGEPEDDVENWLMSFEGLMEAFGWEAAKAARIAEAKICLLYTSDAADE